MTDTDRISVLLAGDAAPEAADWVLVGQALRSSSTSARQAKALRARVAALLDTAQLAEVRDLVDVLLALALEIAAGLSEQRPDVADDTLRGRPGSLSTLATVRDNLESLDFVLAVAMRHVRGLSPEIRDAHDLTRAAVRGAAEQIDQAVKVGRADALTTLCAAVAALPASNRAEDDGAVLRWLATGDGPT